MAAYGGMQAPGGGTPPRPAARPRPVAPKPKAAKPKTVKVKAHTRKIAPRANRPITPGSSITVREAQRMAHDATVVRYGGQEQGINQQSTQAQQLGQAQQGWYQSYLAQLAQYAQDTQNRAGATNTAVQQQADSLRTLDQGQLTAQQQQMNADAAARGATVDPALSQRASDASVVRQALEGSLGATIAQHGLTASNQASDLAHVVAPIQQGQAQAANAQKIAALGEQKTALKGQEGAYAQSFIDNLSGQEAKNILAASIAGQNYSLKSASQQETVRSHKASEGIAKQRVKAQANSPAARKTKAELDFFNKHGYWPSTGPPKAGAMPTSGPGSLKPKDEAAIVQQIHQVVALIQSNPAVDLTKVENGKKVLTGKKHALSDHEIRVMLANGQNPLGKTIDNRIINIAFDVARKGGLSEPNVKAAHDLRIHVNGHFNVLPKSGKVKVQGLSQQQSDTVKGIYGVK